MESLNKKQLSVCVVGATGATGHLLVSQLLDQGSHVKVIVRSAKKIENLVGEHPNLEIIEGNLLEIKPSELVEILADCQAVASCLGHNLSFRGIFGKPRRLVTDAVQILCKSISNQKNNQPVKFVLMNTTGNRNRDLNERVSFVHKCLINLIRLLIPPHADNEAAAEYLRTQIDSSDPIEWVVVRPDTLKDALSISEYEIHPSPVRDALFDPGQTTRINVAHFMSELIFDDKVFQQWKGQMPTIYNKV